MVKDTNCDSEFMRSITDEIGASIHKAFNWVPISNPIHLFTDNAGGHGTELAKLEYMDILKSEYNVEICWQVSNSPETNILDLGVWCLLQSLVEHLHRLKRMNEEALARNVLEA